MSSTPRKHSRIAVLRGASERSIGSTTAHGEAPAASPHGSLLKRRGLVAPSLVHLQGLHSPPPTPVHDHLGLPIHPATTRAPSAAALRWRRLAAFLGLAAASSLAPTAQARYTEGVQVYIESVPALGQRGDIVGRVSGLPVDDVGADFKGILLLNGACNIWWDKGHNIYRFLPDPATAQNAGVPLGPDGSFSVAADSFTTSPYDVLAERIAFFVVPQSFDLSWPAYALENWYIHDYLWNDAVSWAFVDRSGCNDDPEAGCGAANPARVSYVAQQPPYNHALDGGPQEGANCPPPYGPPPPGEPVIPGGPVAYAPPPPALPPAAPAPPAPPIAPAPLVPPTDGGPVDPLLPAGGDEGGSGGAAADPSAVPAEDSTLLPTPAPMPLAAPPTPSPAESSALRGSSSTSGALSSLPSLAAARVCAALLAAAAVSLAFGA